MFTTTAPDGNNARRRRSSSRVVCGVSGVASTSTSVEGSTSSSASVSRTVQPGSSWPAATRTTEADHPRAEGGKGAGGVPADLAETDDGDRPAGQ